MADKDLRNSRGQFKRRPLTPAIRARVVDLGQRGFSVAMTRRMIANEFRCYARASTIKDIYASCGARTTRDDPQERCEMRIYDPPDKVRARWAKLIGPMKKKIIAELTRR